MEGMKDSKPTVENDHNSSNNSDNRTIASPWQPLQNDYCLQPNRLDKKSDEGFNIENNRFVKLG